MRAEQKYKIFCEIACLSDVNLKDQTYKLLNECLGSVSEIMIEREYDSRDIKEQEEYERFIQEKYKIYEECCKRRGLKNLWDDI